ncbi:kinase-like protein [Pseudovirgaria hyperparasitica]|uniref:EKC/KEOPS complex subunit BUD32 n=1 Tax=Pseudovirgaria hyperparasitica TaxID=470096 RepID=A0A6A6WF85_9PEZI|nr:kinase-like protein [Pseudovirgaria hyperparasitica]KAF2761482.1 kinase-like protein [Pseudovirgaria hyperparasitica]
MDNCFIEYPTGFGSEDIVAWGNTGMVCLDAASQTVIKTPHDETHANSLQVERRIYERFQERGNHDGLLRYHGPFDKFGIRLEYAPEFNLGLTLSKRTDIDHAQRLRWVQQITDAVAFIHSVQVIHGDLTCSNVFLTKQLDAKLGDFGGSSLDGSDLLVAVTESHRYPGVLLSTQADIFALGSVMYHIMTGNAPYHSCSDYEIDDRFQRGEFPNTTSLGLVGQVITKCWQAKYDNAEDVHNDIKRNSTLKLKLGSL